MDSFVLDLLRRLDDPKMAHQNHEEVIFEAVSTYILQLMRIGDIPYRFMDDLEKDLREEAREILLKRTYGHTSVRSYRQTKTKTRKARTR